MVSSVVMAWHVTLVPGPRQPKAAAHGRAPGALPPSAQGRLPRDTWAKKKQAGLTLNQMVE